MCSFHIIINDLYESTKIPFYLQLEGEEELIFGDIEKNSENNISVIIDIGHKKGKIKTLKEYENCTDLLKYCIENNLKRIYISKEEILSNIIGGQNISNDIIKNNIPILLNEFYIINIYLENHLNDGLELIKEVYKDYDNVSFIYEDNIVMIGRFEDIEEHAISIKDSISSNIYCKCYISYRKINEAFLLKEAFITNKNNIDLAIKYNLTERIYGERGLLFESIVDSVSDIIKNNIYIDFNDGFSKLDGEMTKTIEVFFECGLNISDASKELYVHRNTLIYRLDKIYKLTSYDIRDFNEAVIFKIAFLIWKERQNINNIN